MSETNEAVALEKAETLDAPEKKAVSTEKADKPAKGDKKKKEKKKGTNIFARFIGAFKDMFAELKKVSWPSKEELFRYTASVLVFVVVCSLFLFLMDVIVSAFTGYINDPSKLPTTILGWFK